MFWKVLLWFVIILVVIVTAFVGIVAIQPSAFRITRSATMSAPPAVVFAQVNDFHNWDKWSPWLELDPSAKLTFEGPSAGTGAIFAWAGNDNMGEGRMELTDSRPNELIRIKLDFIKPFESTADTEFAFRPEGSQTVVTWTMSGQRGFLEKAICLFMDMDKMVGGDFEKGLASIKAVVEKTKK